MHFLHQYSEMARLVLAQSATVHRFGRVIYKLSGKIAVPHDAKRHGINERDFNEVSFFKQNFNDFIKRLLFTEITPQTQGTELYQLLQKKQSVLSNLNELKEEIEQLSNHVEMSQRQGQEKKIHLVS